MGRFKQQDNARYKKIKNRWRVPKGRQSKLRKGKSGNSKKPSIGFGHDKKTKGTIGGKKVVFVNNKEDVKNASKDSIVVISSTLGLKSIAEMDFKGLEVFNKAKLRKVEYLKKKHAKQKEDKKSKKEKAKEEALKAKKDARNKKEDSKKVKK